MTKEEQEIIGVQVMLNNLSFDLADLKLLLNQYVAEKKSQPNNKGSKRRTLYDY